MADRCVFGLFTEDFHLHIIKVLARNVSVLAKVPLFRVKTAILVLERNLSLFPGERGPLLNNLSIFEA